MKKLIYLFVISYKNGRTVESLIYADSFENAVNLCRSKYSERTLKRSALFVVNGTKLVYDFDY